MPGLEPPAPRVAAVVVARDEEAMIGGALRLLNWCDEIIVMVDERTTDETAAIASEFTELVYHEHFSDFSSLRCAGVKHSTAEWIVFCDADERVTPRLATEFRVAISRGTDFWAFSSPTVNFFWGRRMRWGAWNESHVKIVRREWALHEGYVHETISVPPRKIGTLRGERWHFSHRSIAEGLLKAIQYGDLYAQERFESGAPTVTPARMFRPLFLEFARRMIRRAGWRDGTPGLVEACFQPFVRFCAEVMLWERQQQPDIPTLYAELEERVQDQR